MAISTASSNGSTLREVSSTSAVICGYSRINSPSTRPSSKGNYLGATAQVNVESQEQLDKIYHALTAHPMVKMVL